MHRQVLIAIVVFAGAARADEARARVEKPQYVLALSGGQGVKVGAPATVELVLTARGGYHVNRDYPSNLKVDAAADGVKYPRAKLDISSGLVLTTCGGRDPCEARLPLPFTIERAGTYPVGGTFAFCVCNADECLIEKVAVALPVTAAGG